MAMKIARFLFLLACLSAVSSAAEPERDREELYRQYLEFPQLIRGGAIRPLWLEDGERFLFIDDRRDDPAIYLVVPRTATMEPLVASWQLAKALHNAIGKNPDPSSLRLISFGEPERRLLLESGGKRYEAVIGSHPLSFVAVAPPDAPRVVRPATFAHWSPVHEVASPDAITGPQDPHQFRISIEPYLGSPKRNPEAYARDSNLRIADRLKGKLLLIHGTMDDDVPVSETLRLVRALVDAGKRFDLLLLPDERHAFSESVKRYVDDVTRRYLIEHLRSE